MGASYLLDTHVVIWLIGGRPVARHGVLDLLNDESGSVFVSPVSAFEIATKVRLGKLDSSAELASTWSPSIRQLGAAPIDLTASHCVIAGLLDWAHKDPFDRLLVAQALEEGLTLVTADRVVAEAPGVSILPW